MRHGLAPRVLSAAGAGYLEREEVWLLVKELEGGFIERVRPQDLDDALAGMDTDHDGRVALHEFAEWWLHTGSKMLSVRSADVRSLRFARPRR